MTTQLLRRVLFNSFRNNYFDRELKNVLKNRFLYDNETYSVCSVNHYNEKFISYHVKADVLDLKNIYKDPGMDGIFPALLIYAEGR